MGIWELVLMQMVTLGAGYHDEKVTVQKSHPYRVGGLFRLLGRIQNCQFSAFRLFRL